MTPISPVMPGSALIEVVLGKGHVEMLVEKEQFACALGTWIFDARKGLHLSQEAMGEVAGVHRNTILRWERGEAMPTPYQLKRLKNFVKSRAVRA